MDRWFRSGVTGELYIGGEGVARGYLNRPELTQERFVRTVRDDAQHGCTGQGSGRWRADGMIEYVGRNDHQVKIRGFRIELERSKLSCITCTGEGGNCTSREDVPARSIWWRTQSAGAGW